MGKPQRENEGKDENMGDVLSYNEWDAMNVYI